jgi:hypothetical protein
LPPSRFFIAAAPSVREEPNRYTYLSGADIQCTPCRD